MNGVLATAELLEDRLADPGQRAMAHTIRESGAALTMLLNDILDLAKIEAGKLTLEDGVIDLKEVARQVASVHGARAREKRVALEVETDLGCDRARRGDPHRLLQILHNLVSNALKFTESGAVRLTIACAPDGPVELVVRDDGVGMTPEQAAHVFEPFAQAEAGTTRRHGGTGLGLSIVTRLVEQMQGRIALTTAPGEGTEVRVSLPLEIVAGPAAAAPAETPALPDGLRALAADDNEVNRMVLVGLAESLGASVAMAASGAEAVALAETTPADVLFLDISMPDMDGGETLARIREVERRVGRAPAPAVAVTGYAMAHQVAQYRAAGFAAHAAKPLSKASLARAVAEALASRDDLAMAGGALADALP
jgi:CheY-like chemotaxis protein/two-component sensor histidine kinase